MVFYLTIAVMLWVFALVTQWRPQTQWVLGLLALALFVAIGGLRYQTGFDWAPYDRYMHAISDASICFREAQREVGYWALNALVYLAGGTLSAVFFVAALFNGIVYYEFCRRHRAPFTWAAAFYFCWIYLTLQMAVERQAISVSFFLLALLALDQRTYLRTAVLALVGITFQGFSLLYLPLLWRGLWERIWKHLGPILAGCILFTLLMPSPSLTLITMLANSHLPFFATKAASYASPVVYRNHAPADMAYLAFNVLFLVGVRRFMRPSAEARALLHPMVLMVMVEAVLHDFPMLWVRFQMLAIPCQAVFIAQALRQAPWRRSLTAAVLLGCALFSLAIFDYRLHRPFMEVYAPYQDSVTPLIRGSMTEELGMAHTEQMYSQVLAQIRTAEKAAASAPSAAAGKNAGPRLFGGLLTPLKEYYPLPAECVVVNPQAKWHQWRQKLLGAPPAVPPTPAP